MIDAAAFPSASDDPGLAVAERQLELLGELAEMAMVVSRAYAHAAVAAAGAVEAILADEFYQPETGRARALAGARDAAESFQKVSRSLRLTLALQTTVVDALRDMRAGVYRPRIPAARRNLSLDPAGDAPVVAPATRVEAEISDAAARSERADSSRERLVEFDRPDTADGFRIVVNGVRARIGHATDWTARTDERVLRHTPFVPRPPGHETRPGPRPIHAETGDVAAHEEALAP